MRVLRTFGRIHTTDLEATLAARRRAGLDDSRARRFAIPARGLQVVVADDAVIVGGDASALAAVTATQATWLVDDLDAALAELMPYTTAVVASPANVPTGRNATVVLGDVQTELVQWD